MRRERAPLFQQPPCVRQGHFRRKRLLGDGLDAGCAIRQGSSERVAWSSLLRTPVFVSIAIANHVRAVSRPSKARRCAHSDLPWPTRPSPSGCPRGPVVTPSASFPFRREDVEQSNQSALAHAFVSHHKDLRGLARHGGLRAGGICRTSIPAAVVNRAQTERLRAESFREPCLWAIDDQGDLHGSRRRPRPSPDGLVHTSALYHPDPSVLF